MRGQFLEILKSKAKVKINSKVDNRLLRPSDVTLQIPNCEKFKASTGWNVKYDFENSVEHLLEYWRAEVEHA